jgi:hypothetical protein
MPDDNPYVENTGRNNFAPWNHVSPANMRNMPKLLSHSDYWRLQAQEARLAAQRLEDPVARADLLAKADEYDRFAACNREWETRLCKNNSVSSPGGSMPKIPR